MGPYPAGRLIEGVASSRRLRTSTARVAVAVGLVAVLGQACDGDNAEGTAPETWARQVCTEIGAWTEKARARAPAVQRGLAQARNSRELRDRYVTEYGEGVRITDELLTGLDRAGKPAVEEGEAIRRDLRGLFEQLRASIVGAQERVRAASVRNPASFQAELTRINQEYMAAVQRVAGDFERLDDKHDSRTVAKALDDEPACDRMVTG